MAKKTKKTKQAKEAAKSETSESKASDVPEAKPQRTSSAKKDKKKTVSKQEEKKSVKKVVVKGILAEQRVITESSDEAREFYNQSRFGVLDDSGKVELSLLEALYLMEKGRLLIKSDAGRKVAFESYVKKARKVEPNFWIRYIVFKDMRNRGYIIKTALKFGADFRVYDRGIKPGEDHAKWIVFPVHEGSTLTWHEFSAKNRVAHSTRKRLLMGIVDAENDVTYYEVRWTRP
jgi:tRNA-intron endonuclease, archaea type